MSKTVKAKDIVDLMNALEKKKQPKCLRWKMHSGILAAYREWSGNPKATANDVVKLLTEKIP